MFGFLVSALLMGSATCLPYATGKSSWSDWNKQNESHWMTVWTAMPQLTEPANLPSGVYNASPKFFDTTIRQTVKLDLPDKQTQPSLRLRISNAFGLTPLEISHVSIALPLNNSAGTSLIKDGTSQDVTFNAGTDAGVLIPPGALAVSDPFSVDFTGLTTYQSNGTVEAGSILAVSMYLPNGQAGEAVTSHPGSRTTSYLVKGDQTSATNVTGVDAQAQVHWYFISAVEAQASEAAGTFVTVGDSITDGRGSSPNFNNRWPDYLFTRMQSSSLDSIAIANQAAGGNRILADGLGPSALSRLDRDVLAQSGVRYAMIFEGVNDIGTAGADTANQTMVYNRLIAAYRQMITRIHTHNIPVFGATITPFGSLNSTAQPYSDPGGYREQTRVKVNEWIRNSGEFDAVVDFDAAIRDTQNTSRVAARFNSGDDLHPNIVGYQAMADAFPLELFQQWHW